MITNPITPLPTDTYYRAYRLHKAWASDHWVWRVFYGTDWVDTFLTEAEAKAQIDDWHNAR